MTDDGVLESPTCYFKTYIADEWLSCETEFMRQLHARQNERLAYHYFWCRLKSGLLRGCCLANLATAMRYAIATLHTISEAKGFMYMQGYGYDELCVRFTP
jgi:hypothetical protein